MANSYPRPVLPEEDPFHARDAVKSGLEGALAGGAVGFFAAAVQNSLSKQNIGSWAVFTKHGGTIASFAILGTTYKFSKSATANLREKDDYLNTSVGAFLAGSTMGLRAGRIPHIIGYGAVFSLVLTTLDYTGGSIRGWDSRASYPDEYERKEFLRLDRRRPIEQTVAEIGGEGREIKPAGYEERRRQRLQETYGVEINTSAKATVN
ncbi:hypothetical protein SLS62_004611 [Diatrype stigma]|uniref:Uncharacterized protein n=1 Tax=Diatrype stigma TaxID=117547 RepID=A0AAN9YQA8_9PEZI